MSRDETTPVILSACRTPIGKYLGGLSPLPAPKLGALVILAAQAIRAGDEQCIVAGGMESMSNAPHYVYGMRGGIKAGNSQLVDGMILDGLWDSFSNTHMGNLAEYTAKKAGVSREEQDRFALASHQKAVARWTHAASRRRRSP